MRAIIGSVLALGVLAYGGGAAAAGPDEALAKSAAQFCAPFFGGQAFSVDAAKAQARAAGLLEGVSVQPMGLDGNGVGFHAETPDGTGVEVFYMSDAKACQMQAFGPAGTGQGFLNGLAKAGWAPAQTGIAASPDITVDVYVGRPAGAAEDLLLVVNRWTGAAEPQGGMRLIVNMMRPQN